MPPNAIGYWMSDKKIQKSNLNLLKQLCKEHGYDLIKIDLNKSLEQQGPFSIIFHKCTEIIVKANAGDSKCREMINKLEAFLSSNPQIPIVDPLEKVHLVLSRYHTYLTMRDNSRLSTCAVFIPTSVELLSADPASNLVTLKAAGVKFPFVCKPSVAHGSDAHEMAMIFNEKGVRDCKPPAVAQTFINHNAVLYKVYVVGNEFVTVERPSLRNFYSFEDQDTIFFSSADVSKSDSTSSLTVLEADDQMRSAPAVTLDKERLKHIVQIIREDIGLKLMGIDIVVDNSTGLYAVIDVNSFPGYDGFPDVWRSVLTCLETTISDHKKSISRNVSTPDAISPTGDDSGFDTSDSSDEKKRQLIDTTT